jgi:hypothetical protein
MYEPGYFAGTRATLSHILYHNLLIGMQWSPRLQTNYGLGVGDLGIAEAIDARRQRSGVADGHPPHWAAEGLTTITTQMPFDWAEYDDHARDIYLTIWREHPREVLYTIAYYHSRDVGLVFGTYLGFQMYDDQAAFPATYRLFGLAPLAVLLATTFLAAWGDGRLRSAHVLAAGVMLVSSLVVPIGIYAGGFIILAETFICVAFSLYVSIALLLSWLFTRAAAPPPLMPQW